MIRLLHVVAILGLIGSAGYAYSIKYDTLYYAEEVAKVRTRLRQERDSIAVAKAEWALLTRPDRLQRMVDQHLDLQPIGVSQLGRMSDLPVRPPRTDAIAMKLDALIRDPSAVTTTPRDKRPAKSDAIGALLRDTGTATATPNEKRPAKPESAGSRLDALFRAAAAPAAATKFRSPGSADSPATTGSINATRP